MLGDADTLSRVGRPEPATVGLDLVTQRRADYASGFRPDVIGLLPAPVGRVLDIGCGAGEGAQLLRDRGASELVGIEPDAPSAAQARARYDEVIASSVEDSLTWDSPRFDTVLCYDVLEHLYDPWRILKRVATILEPGGSLHVSVPNVRYRGIVLDLLLRGRFTYTPDGVLDVTHIRFFTRKELLDALAAAGYSVEGISTPEPARRASRIYRRLTRDALLEFTTTHWFVLARSAHR